MMIPVTDLKPGDVLIQCRERFYDSRVVAVEPATPGMPTRGPRGGQYRLTAAGADALVVVVLANGKRPLLSKRARAAVHRPE